MIRVYRCWCNAVCEATQNGLAKCPVHGWLEDYEETDEDEATVLGRELLRKMEGNK